MLQFSRRAAALTVCALLGGGLLFLAPVTGSARADEPAPEKTEKPSVDSTDVYYGNASNFRKPAEVDANAVYAEIAEYKKIVADDIEPGSPEYELLMTRASKRFQDALRKVARSGGYDLVARSGSVRNAADVPDVTQDVIGQL